MYLARTSMPVVSSEIQTHYCDSERVSPIASRLSIHSTPFGRKVRLMVESTVFQRFIELAILGNTIILAIYRADMSETESNHLGADQ